MIFGLLLVRRIEIEVGLGRGYMRRLLRGGFGEGGEGGGEGDGNLVVMMLSF